MGLRPPAAGPPEQGGHEDTRPRGYEATGLEPPLEALQENYGAGSFLGGLLGASLGPPPWGLGAPLGSGAAQKCIKCYMFKGFGGARGPPEFMRPPP